MKSCFQNYKTHIDEVIDMQNLLSNIKEENLELTIESIKSSKFYLDKESMKVLLRSISIFIRIRRNKLHIYFQLIDSILPKIVENYTKEEIMMLLTKKEIHCKLFKDKIISEEDIAIFYGFKNLNLAFFYPEMKKLFSKYPSLENNLKESNQYDNIYRLFSQKGDINTISIKDDPRLQIGNINILSIAIRNDDIDSFQSIVSKNNIQIQNHKIKLDKFELNKCLTTDEIYLIEYASYHSSLKIFKFLLMNDAQFSKYLLKYAICGGNHEIVHLAEKVSKNNLEEEDMKEILNLSIIFHRYELFEYMIDNYGIKIQSNGFLDAIFYSNYFFFTNHIIEYEEEYEKLTEIKENSYISEAENLKLEEMKEKLNELFLLSAQNVDPFFIKLLSNFKGIDFNQNFEKNSNKNLSVTNPLVCAIQSKNNENAKFLLSIQDVNPDCQLSNKTTPFTWACFVGNLEMVEYLINNYYINKKDGKGPINVLQVIDQSGENALHLATRESNLDVVKYLISLNIFDLSMKSTQGETPIQTAARLGYKEIFDFLKSASIKAGIKIDDNLTVNEEQFLPQKHIKPLAIAFTLFANLKNPIPLCLLI